MKLAYSTLACPSWSWRRAVEAAREYGYDGIEWRLFGGEMASTRMGAAELGAVREAVEGAGLASCALDTSLHLACPPGPGREKVVEEAVVFLEQARILGAPWLRVFVGTFPAGSTEAQSVAWTVEVLERLVPPARESGVGVALETHAFEGRGLGVSGTSDSEICRRVATALDTPSVRICWDIGNPYLEGEVWTRTWANVREHLGYLHLKDAARSADGSWRYVLNGRGQLPVAEVVHALGAAGYEGWLSFEWEKKWHPEIEDPEVALPRYVEHLGGILAR